LTHTFLVLVTVWLNCILLLGANMQKSLRTTGLNLYKYAKIQHNICAVMLYID